MKASHSRSRTPVATHAAGGEEAVHPCCLLVPGPTEDVATEGEAPQGTVDQLDLIEHGLLTDVAVDVGAKWEAVNLFGMRAWRGGGRSPQLPPQLRGRERMRGGGEAAPLLGCLGLPPLGAALRV